MKQFPLALALAGAFLFGGLAAPASALVDDRPNALAPTAERNLERELARLGAHRFDVVFVDRPVGSASRMAETEFKRRNLGPKDGLILVAVKTKQVGVSVGTAFEARGVSGAAVSQQIQSRFLPAARRGDFGRASVDLARGLIAAGSQGAPMASNRRTTSNTMTTTNEAPTRRRSGGGGFPWGLIAIVAIGGVGVWYFLNKQKGANVEGRLAALRESQEAIMSGALKLGEVDSLGKFHEGAAAQAYQTLAKRAEKLLRKATWFGNKFHDAEKAIAAKKPGEAEPILVELEKEVTALESAIVAAVSALEQLERGVTPSAEALAQVDMSELVEAIANDLQELQALYDQERTRARRVNVGNDVQVESRLAAAKRYITEAPLDPKKAKKALKDAKVALTEYSQRIEAEADREVEREAHRSQQRNDGAWMAAAAAPVFMSHGHDHHDHHSHHEQSVWGDVGSSAEGSWGASDDAGSSAEGSWGDSSSDASSDSSDDSNSGSW